MPVDLVIGRANVFNETTYQQVGNVNISGKYLKSFHLCKIGNLIQNMNVDNMNSLDNINYSWNITCNCVTLQIILSFTFSSWTYMFSCSCMLTSVGVGKRSRKANDIIAKLFQIPEWQQMGLSWYESFCAKMHWSQLFFLFFFLLEWVSGALIYIIVVPEVLQKKKKVFLSQAKTHFFGYILETKFEMLSKKY